MAHIENSLLPKRLQAENNEAAHAAIFFIVEALNEKETQDELGLVSKIAGKIHREWIARIALSNYRQVPEWMIDEKQNLLPFKKLSKERQEWFFSVAKEGINLVKDYIASKVS